MMISLIWTCMYFRATLADVLFNRGHYFASFDNQHNYNEALRFCSTLHDYQYETRLLFVKKTSVKNYLPYWLEGRKNGKIN